MTYAEALAARDAAKIEYLQAAKDADAAEAIYDEKKAAWEKAEDVLFHTPDDEG